MSEMSQICNILYVYELQNTICNDGKNAIYLRNVYVKNNGMP